MSQPAKYNCPHCKNQFSINDPSLYGKQIRCPTCSKVLVVPAPKKPAPTPTPPTAAPINPLPQAPASTFPSEPNIWETELPAQQPAGNFPAAPTRQQPSAPMLRTGPPKKKKGKKKKKTNFVAPLIVIGAIAGILIPAGVFSFFYFNGRGADGNVVDMTWLPEDTETLSYVNVQRVVNSQLFRDHIASEKRFDVMTKEMQKETGLTLSDIQSVTVGAPKNNQNAITVVRLSSDLDPSKIDNNKSEEVNGYTLYTKNRQTLMAADSRTYLFGPTDALNSLAQRGPVTRRFPKFDFADSSQDVLVCVVPKDKSVFSNNSPMPPMFGAPPGVAKASETVKTKANGFAFGATISGANLDVKIQADMVDSVAGSELSTGINEAITEGKTQYESMGGNLPANIKTLTDQVIASLDVGSSGKEAILTMRLPLDAIIKQAKSSGLPMPGPFSAPAGGLPDFGNIFN